MSYWRGRGRRTENLAGERSECTTFACASRRGLVSARKRPGSSYHLRQTHHAKPAGSMPLSLQHARRFRRAPAARRRLSTSDEPARPRRTIPVRMCLGESGRNHTLVRGGPLTSELFRNYLRTSSGLRLNPCCKSLPYVYEYANSV